MAEGNISTHGDNEEEEWPPWDDDLPNESEIFATGTSKNDSFSKEPADKPGESPEIEPRNDDGGGFFHGDEEVDICDECQQRFTDSWLFKQFSCRVCDKCRDRNGKHSLITKTDAKSEYFLKDADFDIREPALKCIVKKNPHNGNWGDMKLYLRCQVEDRAIEVWGSEEAVEAEREKRKEQKEKSKKRTFDKMIKALRMNARSSLGKQVKANHEHAFDAEEYDEERDMYSKKCKTCDHVNEYEKM